MMGFGTQRRRAHKPRLIGDEVWAWLEAAGAGFVLAVFMAGVIILTGMFPKGLAPIRDLHITIVSGKP